MLAVSLSTRMTENFAGGGHPSFLQKRQELQMDAAAV